MADPSILDALAGHAADPSGPIRVKRRAQQILDRITKPLRIAVISPDATGLAHVQTTLQDHLADAFGDKITVSGVPMADAHGSFSQIDVAVWWTTQYTAEEQSVWSSAPDVLKDNSFLAAPAASSNPHLTDIAAYEFRGLLDASQDALSPLVSALLERISRGQEADEDQAIAFLTRHGLPRREVRFAPETPPQTDAAASPDVLIQATTYIDKQAGTIAKATVADTPDCREYLLSLCAETADGLADMFGAADPTTLPEPGLADDILLAADAITLMSIEDTIGAAADAVSTLLHIQKDLKTLTITSNV